MLEHSAIIIGSGPSVDSWDAERVREILGPRPMKVFSVNMALKSRLAQQLGVDYAVFSDPSHEPVVSRLLGNLTHESNRRKHAHFFIPRSWSRLGNHYASNTTGFEDKPLLFFGRGWSPVRARRYPSMTFFKALSIAWFMGFSRIYVIGLDHSQFLGLEVSLTNEITEGRRYAQGTHGGSDGKLNTPNGLSDYFYSLAFENASLRHVFGSAPVINLNPDSFVDFFPKRAS